LEASDHSDNDDHNDNADDHSDEVKIILPLISINVPVHHHQYGKGILDNKLMTHHDYQHQL
jgi:hypothetical protein